jgi:hypothetical protein
MASGFRRASLRIARAASEIEGSTPGLSINVPRTPIPWGNAVYVLHAFQKKSTRGITTPQHEIDVVRRRLVDAEQLYWDRQN